MATRGRDNVMFLGWPTAGVPTDSRLFEFADSSAVNLTLSIVG